MRKPCILLLWVVMLGCQPTSPLAEKDPQTERLEALAERATRMEVEIALLTREQSERAKTLVDMQTELQRLAQELERQHEESSQGFLTVNAKPEGTQVFVDGNVVGVTPLKRHQIEPGSHTVRVYFEEHKEFSATKRALVTEGRHISLYFSRRVSRERTEPSPSSEEKGMGFLTVNANPTAQVYVGGLLVSSQTPLVKHKLKAGTHKVRVFHVELKKFSETKRATITDGRHVSLFFEVP